MIPATLVPWLVAAMRSWQPTDDAAEIERYARFAGAVAVASVDRPITGDEASTAVLLLAIASFESGGFRADVMSCKVNGDNGASRGPFQVQRASGRVCVDHEYAARVALERVVQSWNMCGRGPGELAGYTAGRCSSVAGRRLSALYRARAERWLRASPFLVGVD